MNPLYAARRKELAAELAAKPAPSAHKCLRYPFIQWTFHGAHPAAARQYASEMEVRWGQVPHPTLDALNRALPTFPPGVTLKISWVP